MSKKECCTYQADVKLIFPCSGGGDVGAIADLASRRMTGEGLGKMSCLAGIGGGLSGFIRSAEAASKVLVIDGCGTDCAKKCLENARIKDFVHLRVTDLGFKKGNAVPDDENINTVFLKAKKLLE